MDKLPTKGLCRAESVIAGAQYRFTLLTARLIRLEYAPDGVFEDLPTQTALDRDFETPPFLVREAGGLLEIDTEFLSLRYDKGIFSPGGLSIKVLSPSRGIYSTWHFGDPLLENLGGTARTLDQADGRVPLEHGLQSRLQGYSLLDDSTSLLLLEDGWVASRREGIQDLYFFGYGYAYDDCLRDFFHLAGQTPLLPRYVFGNWWSRFYPYNERDYKTLMDRFAAEKIPLSVAVLDMDWHITEVDPRHGKGWTGYTWNRKLFPEPEKFLEQLHRRDLKAPLNLHPAEGIQPHEAQYPQACAALGRDSTQGLPIHFDFCDPAFIRVYFEQLLHPEEDRGVDFWWVDWQQGDTARFRGADPLWLLNHFHHLNSARGEKRPLIFSRYAGPGSHRYPIGFSGDSVISWASLDFQPFFTAAAANIGYGWWSHDIGGHCGGAKDEELMVRWLQFGVFSPIMRLHSTSNLFNGKEPWKYGESAARVMGEYLRLRHALVPYLYTMNYHCARQGRIPLRPMYYSFPEKDAAYEVPNQYEFGSELIVCPITSPAIPGLKLGKTTAWLPERLYFDFFTGLRYHGCRKLNLYRPLGLIPVLAKAGAIVPLAGERERTSNGTVLPEELEVRVFAGSSGHYELYEDDGETKRWEAGEYAVTIFDFRWNCAGTTVLTITAPKNGCGLLPQGRRYTVRLVGVGAPSGVRVAEGGASMDAPYFYDSEQGAAVISLPPCGFNHPIAISFDHAVLGDNRVLERVFALLEPMEIGYELKERIYRCISCSNGMEYALCQLQTMALEPDILSALAEILFAK